jgi:hypothetical protein
MSKVFFLCPDDNRPYGGVRVLYRCVDTLNVAGISATVVHRKVDFRCTWFENKTSVTPASEVRFTTGDLLVLPEWYRESIPEIAPGVPHLVFNQNPHETFTGSEITKGSWKPVVSADTVGIVANSPYTFEYLSYSFPHIPIYRITLGIDPGIFFPPEGEKEKSIAFMPRKRRRELVQLLRVLDLRGALGGWTLRAIDGMTEAETARILRDSAVFLSLNDREGFGLPPLEAMASGCIVVGFHGGCGRLYMRPGTSLPIDDGEIILFAREVESVLERFGSDDGLDRMSQNAVELVRSEFSIESEAADVVSVFGGVLERVALIEPKTRVLNSSLLKRSRFPPLKEMLAYARMTRNQI